MTPFFMAWGMFWIVPCPVKKWDMSKYKEMLLCMPAIGLLIGALWLGLHRLLTQMGLAGTGLYAALMMLLPWCLTGFIHLDGYMDCSDAVLSRRDLPERLRILKDPHVGAFAVIMMAVLCVLSYGIWDGLQPGAQMIQLLFVPVISRCCSAVSVLCLQPLETSSYARMHAEGISGGYKAAAVIMTLCAAAAAIITGLLTSQPYSGLCAAVEIAAYALTAAALKRNLGGMSGDISGCAITVSELCAVAALRLFI